VVNHLYAIEAVTGTINIFGGNISAGSTAGNSFVNTTTGIDAVNGTVKVMGTGFNLPYGPIAASSGILTGLLQDGSPLNVSFSQLHPGGIILVAVPEPGVAAIGVLAVLCLAAARRARQ
jgi:hypothetical protein